MSGPLRAIDLRRVRASSVVNQHNPLLASNGNFEPIWLGQLTGGADRRNALSTGARAAGPALPLL